MRENYWKKIAFILVGVIFFLAYSFLIFKNPAHRFTWPDEMANFHFTQQFASEGGFRTEEPMNVVAEDIVLPRSMTIVDHDLAPIGFLGLPLIYGVVAAFVPDWWVVFITPLLAVGSAFFIYKIVSKLRNEREGIISGVLLLITPAFAYYANFSMLPNIPMMFFLLASVFFGIKATHSRQVAHHFINSGLMLGLALMIRPVELVWIAPVLLFFVIYLRNQIKFRYFIIFLLPLIALGLVYLYFNNETYNSISTSGYSLTEGSILASENLIQKVYKIIFPFGISLGAIYSNLTNFVISPQWYWFVIMVLAAAVGYFNHSTKEYRAYIIIWKIVSLFLIVMYCSWQLPDTFVLSHSKIGISFTRYLLPMFVGAVPLIAAFIVKSFEKYKNVTVTSLLVVLVLVINTLYLDGNDNLLKIRASVNELNVLHNKLMNLSHQDSVIVTKRGDKIAFPQRAVVSQYTDSELYKFKNLILAGIEVKYLFYNEEIKVDEFNRDQLSKLDLQLVNKRDLGYGYKLYDLLSIK